MPGGPRPDNGPSTRRYRARQAKPRFGPGFLSEASTRRPHGREPAGARSATTGVRPRLRLVADATARYAPAAGGCDREHSSSSGRRSAVGRPDSRVRRCTSSRVCACATSMRPGRGTSGCSARRRSSPTPRRQWAPAKDRSVYVVEHADGAGQSVATILVDDLDGQMAAITAQGLQPDEIETYSNGVRKAVYRDPDGNELGFGGAPRHASSSTYGQRGGESRSGQTRKPQRHPECPNRDALLVAEPIVRIGLGQTRRLPS